MPDFTGCVKHPKFWIFLLFMVFCAVETPFSLVWVHQQGGLLGTHFNFWHQIFHDPLYQVTAIDFGATAVLVFAWMVQDSRRRHQIFLPWLWLPIFLYSPSLGLFGYLLTRKSSADE